jgi:aspartate aminotransferase-like enzyme
MHTQNDILLIAGSATYGEEAALLSLLEAGQKVLTANTGVYGQVLTDLARIVGAAPVEIAVPEGQAVDPEEIAARLAADPEIAMVAVAYCDTSTGIMNPVAEIGTVMRDYPQVLFVVDAVSALAAVEVRVDEWGIDACCTSPQKCLNAPQGLAIVSVSDRAWRAIATRRTPIRSLCLDLTVWRDYHRGVKETYESGGLQDISLVTPKAVHGPSPSYVLVAGLAASLEALFEEGPEHSFRRHELAGRAVRSAARALGLGVRAREQDAAPMSTAIIYPQGLGWADLARTMLEKHGIAMAAGYRIGTMGMAADPRWVLPTIAALEATLRSLGYDVPVGAGVAAARTVYGQAGI